MAIQAAMREDNGEDMHEHDLVMPGFRFHPTEEELIEFYLRRKVEGKHFNVELITFLDLYRYDPWELPAFAAIGEKEWFFYVPRDRKYRNGDRPNRVTTSGYWKATGADRMIRAEDSRSIGLKKTLVFYTGKAPKGVRTSWIMSEYRLPQSEIERYQKVEIALCRVHKRSGVNNHRNLAGTLNHKPSSSRATSCDKRHNTDRQLSPSSFTALEGEASSLKMEKTSRIRSTNSISNNWTQALCNHIAYGGGGTTPTSTPMSSTTSIEEDGSITTHQLLLASTSCPFTSASIDDLTKLVGFSQLGYLHQPTHHLPFSSQPQSLPLHAQANRPNTLMTNISDKLWDWNPLPDAGSDYTIFK